LPAFQYTAVARLGGVVSRVFFMRGLPATGLGGDGGAQAAQVAVEHLGGQFAVQREQAVDGGLLFATQGFAAGLFRLRLFARGQHGIAAGGLFVEAALFFTAGALAGLLPLLAQLRQAGAVEVVHRAAGVLGDLGQNGLAGVLTFFAGLGGLLVLAQFFAGALLDALVSAFAHQLPQQRGILDALGGADALGRVLAMQGQVQQCSRVFQAFGGGQAAGGVRAVPGDV